MLTYDLLPRTEGIRLYGDKLTLDRYWKLIHDVNNRSSVIQDKEGFFIGLAYDIRKAKEGQRRVHKPDKDEIFGDAEAGTRYGCGILWPTILVQSRQFRTALAFMDHTKNHQAAAYELEWLLECAINAQFKQKAEEIMVLWNSISGAHPYVEKNASTRVYQFAAWTSAERKSHLPGLLRSLDPIYPALYRIWVKQGATDLISPEEYQLWENRDFPGENLSPE